MIETSDSLQNILSQEEIDALLSPRDNTLSLNTLLTPKEKAKPEIYPSFERHLDIFSRTLITTLRHVTEGKNISVNLSSYISGQLGSYLDTIKTPAFLGFFIDKGKNIPGLVSIDSMLAYTLIDMALGGRRGTAAMQIEERHYTQIERSILEKFIKTLISNLGNAFQVSFSYEGIDTNPQTALIDASGTEMLITRLSVQIDNRNGLFDIVFPYSATQILEIENHIPHSEDIIKNEWQNSLAQTVSYVPMEINAVLDTKTLPFKSILEWRPGHILPLTFFKGKPIQLVCQDTPIFQGHLDTHNQNIKIILDKKTLKEA